MKFDAGNITKESISRQKVGELIYWANDRNISEEEVHSALTVNFGNGSGDEAVDKNNGSESEETVVQNEKKVVPITGEKVRETSGVITGNRSKVIP